MQAHLLFPFTDYWLAYLGFTVLIGIFLALDLGVFHRTPKPVSFREATLWSVVWLVVALLFNWGLYIYGTYNFPDRAEQTALEFLSGYLVERALSVDNIFVFSVVFSYFAIPPAYQHRVLFYGIIGAFVFRAIFVALGAVLMQFHWVVIFFGLLLIVTAVKMALASDAPADLSRNWFLRVLRRWIPITTRLHGPRFFHGRAATPLFAALAILEVTDIVFALDSVPAIFALTREPFIVFTSNIFAILGLRAMYFMLAGAMDRFHLLKYGLAAVLAFVGLKMVWLNPLYGGKFPIGWSLGIICALLAVPLAISLLYPKPQVDQEVQPEATPAD